MYPADCAGTADEVKSSLAYDSNGNITSVSTGAGAANSPAATQTMTYDSIGNLVTVDGPLPGAEDTTRFRYNAARERIGEIGPDPDGPPASAGPEGALKHRASRTTLDGQSG